MITPKAYQVRESYKGCMAYLRSPEAHKSSVRSLKSGGHAGTFFDIDPMLNDPIGCRDAAYVFVERLEKLARQQRVDCFASIEKAGGGTIGLIRSAGERAATRSTGCNNN